MREFKEEFEKAFEEEIGINTHGFYEVAEWAAKYALEKAAQKVEASVHRVDFETGHYYVTVDGRITAKELRALLQSLDN